MYYYLGNSIEKKQIGKFPQSITTAKRGNLDDIMKESPIQGIPDLPEPIIVPKALPSTYLGGTTSINTIYFLVLKDYFIEFLKVFKVGEYQTWPLKVHYRDEVLNYYRLFHLSYPSTEQIVDYTNSKFVIGIPYDWRDEEVKRKSINITGHENYLSTREVLKSDDKQIRCEKLVLNFSNVKEDIIRICDLPYGNGYWVSERLKNAIEEKGYTGMEFRAPGQFNEDVEVI